MYRNHVDNKNILRIIGYLKEIQFSNGPAAE